MKIPFAAPLLVAAFITAGWLGGCTSRLLPRSDDPQVTVCHRGKTVAIGRSALGAHLDHGDHMGACR